MQRAFTFSDIEQDCDIETGVYTLDRKKFGAVIHVPDALKQQYPYNVSAYEFMQQLRQPIFEFGTLELPGLAVNKQNHTLAQRSPFEHSYSSNTYTTDLCQLPHQDCPPYPTAFWLPEQRRFSATWVMSETGLNHFHQHQQAFPSMPIEERHQLLVDRSLEEGWGLLYNQQPGLLLIDNSQHHRLYHARTANFAAMESTDNHQTDTAMYAFNEIGLLQYIDMLDERRGNQDRDAAEVSEVRRFMAEEGLQPY
ncbi:Uncharacterised protein [BD1-7 clade bacterium]|uniref:Uncharacterized protein n=1 Tax=BD1-7 clade bacterium TaxID=2029982 RepID=A0A5S9NXM4_9GAMM|nr:Uncharacterised protein [BD1-7 clade bacterium]CAA0095453.1 Uncharacterised protein [BD1-7 clade bacterium]